MASIGGQRTWDPHSASVFEDLHCGSSMWSQIIRYNPINSSELIGDAAERWEVRNGGSTYTFYLREGIQWTDGVELTADDVVFSIERMIGGGDRPQVSKITPYVETVKKVDKYTVQVDLNFPSGAFIQFIGTFWYKILPKHYLEDKPDDHLRSFENLEVGSGPFRPKEFTPGTLCTFEKNPNHFNEGRPYLDGFTGHIITDKATQLAAFKTERILGSLSLCECQTAPEDLLRLEDDEDFMSKFDIWYGPTQPGASLYIMLNPSVEPFNDRRVRQAMFLTLDRKTIADGFGLGRFPQGRPIETDSAFSLPDEELEKIPGYRTLDGKKHPQDIADAKELMRQAGFNENNRLQVDFIAPIVLDFPDHAQVIADQYREIFIDLQVRPQEIASSIQSFTNRDFKVGVLGDAPSIHDPDDRFQSSYTVFTPRNFTDWHDEEIDEIFLQQQRETDPAKRLELVYEMQRKVLQAAPAVIEYMQIIYFPIVSKRIKTALGHYHKCNTLYKCYQHDVEWLDDEY